MPAGEHAQFFWEDHQVSWHATPSATQFQPSESTWRSIEHMLQVVDQCPVSRRQRLKLYKLNISPKLTWLLTITELPITWVARELRVAVTWYLKQVWLSHPTQTCCICPRKMVLLVYPQLYQHTSCFKPLARLSCSHLQTPLWKGSWENLQIKVAVHRKGSIQQCSRHFEARSWNV